MSLDDDIDVFFQLGDPGIEEATHIDENSEPQPLIGEFLNNSESHSSGTRHINQSNPAFKLPEIYALAVEIGHTVIINEQNFEVSEKLTIANAICILYLTRAKAGGDHRWK